MGRPRKDDPRYDAKTQMIEAFIRLSRKVPIDEITVKMVVDAVGCNKTTFYYHFNYIEDLRQAAIEQSGIGRTTHAVIEKVLSGDWVQDVSAADSPEVKMLDQLCSLVALNATGQGREHITAFISSALARALDVDPDSTDYQTNVLLSFMTGGVCDALRYRGQTGNAIPVDEFCHSIYDTVAPAIYKKLRERAAAKA
ncbi:MAG: TetR/AcrR family transcriptional regulator [Tractidigestivibacter sp.]|jgi:AcrR family transcriptional regulator|uniref:TetR/AcrR family transcriptional regulator n=1 Tax=Tractidigestivibacter sp. TaxID=2847320 RepID=UPI003D8D4ADA